MDIIQRTLNTINLVRALIKIKLYILCGFTFFKPSIIRWKITSKCNGNCKMCPDRVVKIPPQDLSTKEFKDLLIKLRRWLGPFNFHISGGEPLARKDFFELMDFADSLGIRCMLHTNGTLINKKNIKKLGSANIKDIRLALQGFEYVHDKVIQKKGAYKKAINALKLIKSNLPNTCICIHTVIQKNNVEELPAFVEYLTKYNPTYINLMSIFQRDFTRDAPLKERPDWYKTEIWPDYKKVEKSIDKIIEFKKRGYPIHNTIEHLENIKRFHKDPENVRFSCTEAQTFSIFPDGMGRICSLVVGNVKDDPEKIWFSKKARNLRRALHKCRRGCSILHSNDSFYSYVKRFIKMHRG